jgi:NADP-dependent 3-hydroxy acid dehydrogenase YdfG
MFRLDGKVAVVTGASSGLGVAFAQALAEAGADVVLGARRVDRLEQTRQLVEGCGRRALVVQTDVADPEARARAGRRTGQQRRRRHGCAGHPGDA